MSFKLISPLEVIELSLLNPGKVIYGYANISVLDDFPEPWNGYCAKDGVLYSKLYNGVEWEEMSKIVTFEGKMYFVHLIGNYINESEQPVLIDSNVKPKKLNIEESQDLIGYVVNDLSPVYNFDRSWRFSII